MGLYEKVCASLERIPAKPIDKETLRKALGLPSEGQSAMYAERKKRREERK